MNIEKVWAVYFSPTGNVASVVDRIAEKIAGKLGKPCECIDFTLPGSRNGVYSFSKGDLVVFGVPTYAGRIPNKILPFVQEGFFGGGALLLPVALYGNRSAGDTLMELRNELGERSFRSIAAASIPGSHVFSDKIAPGRPDESDLQEIDKFADKVADNILALDGEPGKVVPEGNDPVGPYYTPLGLDGNPAKFLKAKPITDAEKCKGCGLCAGVCPMGSIDAAEPSVVSGVCIKCQACIKTCPAKAKHFEDEAFLSHVAYLEKNYTARKESRFYFAE